MRQRSYLLDQLAGLVIFSTDRPGRESIPPGLVGRACFHAVLRHAQPPADTDQWDDVDPEFDLEPTGGSWEGCAEHGWALRATADSPTDIATEVCQAFGQDAVLLHDPAPYGPFGRGVWRLVNATGADLAKPVAFESVEFIPPGSAENHTTLALGVAGSVSFRIPFAQ